jgi:FdhD protein
MQGFNSQSSNPDGQPGATVTREYEIIDITEQGVEKTWVEVSVEDSINLSINGMRVASLTLTPKDLEAYAYGYCICEGLVSSASDITGITIEPPNISITVSDPAYDPSSRSTEIRSSGCVGVKTSWESLTEPLPDGLCVDLQTIFDAMEKIRHLSKTWRITGGTHCSVILDEHGEIKSAMEDMGRHNSVDKAVGRALLDGVDLSRCFMVVTGRLPAGMVAKAYRAGIPVLVSNTSPFSTGICLARQVNMTLAGFARPPRMMIYSAPDRVTLPETFLI